MTITTPMMVAGRQVLSAAELREHYRQVRLRLSPPARPPAPPVVVDRPARLPVDGPIDVRVADAIWRWRELQRQQSRFPRRNIIAAVSAAFGIGERDLCGPGRRGYAVEARQIAMTILMLDGGTSYHACGQVFRRDHSTVVHAVHKYRALVAPLLAATDQSANQNWPG